MHCPNCPNENTRDFPVCPTCEPSCHFTNRADCRCEACQNERAARAEREALAEAAWIEELQFEYGRFVQAAA